MKYVELRIYHSYQTATLTSSLSERHNLVSFDRMKGQLSNYHIRCSIFCQSKRLLPTGVFAMVATLIVACSTISPYDQTAYLQAVNGKVDALTLMGKATDLYGNHQNDVATVQTELQKAYEYERGRPLNKETVAQWNILLDQNGDLLGAFVKEWKENGKLLPVYVKRKQDQISKAFDEIIQLESGKIRTASG